MTSEVDFDDVPVGTTVTSSFEVHNTGGTMLVGQMQSGCEQVVLTAGNGPFELPPGEIHSGECALTPIAPGPFESKMMEHAMNTMKDQIAAGNPMARIGAPADMAGVAIYLASAAGSYVNGAVIPVDGGSNLGTAIASP